MQDDPVRLAYARWSAHYDADDNRTRDAALAALERLLVPLGDRDVLEIGCGTGQSTRLLAGARSLVALDFSEEMMARARAKVPSARFLLHDVREPWPLPDASVDLVTENLVLEHVEALGPVLGEMARVLRPGGAALLFELHPYRQLLGKQARFETDAGTVKIPAFAHSISELVQAALKAGFSISDLGEWSDGAEPIPRVLSLSLEQRV
jgi:ubiquinone/menaquinone biosynthesis C-methylase UbiE